MPLKMTGCNLHFVPSLVTYIYIYMFACLCMSTQLLTFILSL